LHIFTNSVVLYITIVVFMASVETYSSNKVPSTS